MAPCFLRFLQESNEVVVSSWTAAEPGSVIVATDRGNLSYVSLLADEADHKDKAKRLVMGTVAPIACLVRLRVVVFLFSVSQLFFSSIPRSSLLLSLHRHTWVRAKPWRCLATAVTALS
jgi:protein-S-isoprenylcysteine O-methyltransferase Ste14